jgi:hypothetical protein
VTQGNKSVLQVVRTNLARVEKRIAAACERSGRPREAVTLVAVTKTRTLDDIRAAYACGVRDLGENRIEELAPRAEALLEEFAADPPRWHMIGHVQSRKAVEVVGGADLLHSLDSIRLAERLDRFAAEAGRILPVLVECNVSGEASKEGFAAWSEELLPDCLAALARLEALPHLAVRGLMTMAPYEARPEQTRPVFRRLRHLQGVLRVSLPFAGWDELSMGMTNDYVVAVEEGATMVRIGRAIFGEAD